MFEEFLTSLRILGFMVESMFPKTNFEWQEYGKSLGNDKKGISDLRRQNNRITKLISFQ